jgi:hypothetical protein
MNEIKTVGDLVTALLKQDQTALVGCALSGITGWVNGIARVTTTDLGVVVIDQTEETLDEEEQHIL